MPTPSVLSHLDVAKRGNVTIVRFGEHRILNEVALDLIGDGLSRVAEEPDCSKLLLDFAGVGRLTSSMLAKLLVLKRKMQSKGGKLTLCDIGPEIGGIFKSTGLDQLFDVRENEAEALKAFG